GNPPVPGCLTAVAVGTLLLFSSCSYGMFKLGSASASRPHASIPPATIPHRTFLVTCHHAPGGCNVMHAKL
ncbi:MAG TPA: hypothetical protein VFR09_01960, partial [Alphaproteobacteria bacterium]|nr:hypothetical protein [Alphaproteobacteria bacterium]